MNTKQVDVFDFAEIERNAAELRKRFRTARPFPHIVIDDLLEITSEEASSFPTIDWEGWKALGDRYQHNKRSCNDISRIPAPFDALIGQLSQPRFLRLLETITGIERLLPIHTFKEAVSI